MNNPIKSYFALALVTVLVAACASPVGQQDSGIKTPSFWVRLTGQSNETLKQPIVIDAEANVDQQWWQQFNDPTLNTLITEALNNSQTLQIAKARVEEAKASRQITESRLYPEINAQASASRGNQGFATQNQTVNLSQVNLGATWELDLFGRNKAKTAEASAILQSTEAAQQAVRVGLLTEVARNYFEMRNYARLLDIAKANLDTQKKTLELIQVQLKGALASDFDVQRAGAQVSATESLIPTLEAAYNASLNRLNVLLGYPPGSKDDLLKANQASFQPLDHHIVIGAPAKVLATRPDVRVAERQFAASISAKDAARADLFPDISLTALFGAQSASPFSSTPWGLGISLIQPILNFGRIEAQINVAEAKQKQAFLNYQKTILLALEDMENALSNYIHETTRNASLATGVAQNRKAADLAQQQYTNGYTALLDVLVVQRNLLDAEAAQAASDASLRIDLVNIYAAAGGGWKD